MEKSPTSGGATPLGTALWKHFGTFRIRMDPGHIDLSYLERLFKGDRARIHAWIRIYREEAPAQFQRLADAVACGDAQALALGAHELRPLAHYLGTPRILQLLMAVTEKARTGDTNACREEVAELVTLGNEVDTELGAVLIA